MHLLRIISYSDGMFMRESLSRLVNARSISLSAMFVCPILLLRATPETAAQLVFGEHVAVRVFPGKGERCLNGAIPVVVEVTNQSASHVLFDFHPYPRAQAHFRPRMDSIVSLRAERIKIQPEKSTMFKLLQPGERAQGIIYLNRDIIFLSPGTVSVDYNLEFTYWPVDERRAPVAGKRKVSTQGQFDLILRKCNEQEIRGEIEAVAKGQLSPDKTEKISSIIALAYYEPRFALEHLKVALRDPSPEVKYYALRVAGELKATNVIVSTLHDPDSLVLRTALAELVKLNVLLDASTIESLLASDDPSTRYHTLIDYVKPMAPARIKPIVAPLVNDQNPDVARAARSCMEILE
jgi:hypothetical protein